MTPSLLRSRPLAFVLLLLAGAGVKKGHIHGETDEYSYNIVRDGVHVHDLNATILHLMGVDHTRLSASVRPNPEPSCRLVQEFQAGQWHHRGTVADASLARNRFPDQASGFVHRRPGKRAKSPSVEQRTHPCSMASAARCASGTRFPVA